MTTEEITKKLVRGSRNIDRMKKEVEQVVSTINGLVKKNSGPTRRLDETFESALCQWNVRGEINPHRGGDHISVECNIKIEQDSFLGYYNDGNNVSLRSEDTQTVYECLPVFVDGMINLFPRLAVQLRPYLRAADVFPE